MFAKMYSISLRIDIKYGYQISILSCFFPSCLLKQYFVTYIAEHQQKKLECFHFPFQQVLLQNIFWRICLMFRIKKVNLEIVSPVRRRLKFSLN